jgi:hypothetical protein
MHAICCFQTEIFLIAEAVPASHQISRFNIQKAILKRCQCVIDPSLTGRDSEITKELYEIFVVYKKATQAVCQIN